MALSAPSSASATSTIVSGASRVARSTPSPSSVNGERTPPAASTHPELGTGGPGPAELGDEVVEYETVETERLGRHRGCEGHRVGAARRADRLDRFAGRLGEHRRIGRVRVVRVERLDGLASRRRAGRPRRRSRQGGGAHPGLADLGPRAEAEHEPVGSGRLGTVRIDHGRGRYRVGAPPEQVHAGVFGSRPISARAAVSRPTCAWVWRPRRASTEP